MSPADAAGPMCGKCFLRPATDTCAGCGERVCRECALVVSTAQMNAGPGRVLCGRLGCGG